LKRLESNIQNILKEICVVVTLMKYLCSQFSKVFSVVWPSEKQSHPVWYPETISPETISPNDIGGQGLKTYNIFWLDNNNGMSNVIPARNPDDAISILTNGVYFQESENPSVVFITEDIIRYHTLVMDYLSEQEEDREVW